MKVRHKYLLIAAAVWGPCLMVATAFYGLVLRPQVDYRHRLETDIVQAKEDYARAVEAARPDTQARLTEQVERLRGRVADFLIGLEEAPSLAFEIGDLAYATRLESFGMKPTNARASGPQVERLNEKRLQVNFVAGFPRFAAFLNALERHQPAVFVETFTINRPMETDAEPRVDMGLAVLVEKPQGDEL